MLPDWRTETASEVDHLYSIALNDPSVHDSNHGLYLGDSIIEASDNVEDLLDALRQSIHLQIGTYAQNKIFVHAGVVAWRGQAIVMPGRTHAGKSTLVKAMVDAGAAYYSDEFAVIDPKGRVLPYPRSLALRRGKRQGPRRLHAEELGWRDTFPPLSIGAIVVTWFQPGSRWEAAMQQPGLTVLDLYANTVSARTNTRLAFGALVRAADGAKCFKGPRGEAELSAAAVLARVGGDQDAPSKSTRRL